MTYKEISDFLDKCETLHPDIAGIESVATNEGQFWPMKKWLATYNEAKEYCKGFIARSNELNMGETQISLRVITKYAEKELTLKGIR